jgi:hypothetical protein
MIVIMNEPRGASPRLSDGREDRRLAPLGSYRKQRAGEPFVATH